VEGGPCASVAMVFQTFALLPWLDVRGNVELGLKARGVPRDARRQKALRMIELIGLDGFESAYPRELSGGMRQRVGVACLEEHFSTREARRQLDTAVDWGRYAELFAFEDDSDELFLEPV
jgi:ABC-type hemin transport system ATPase subunit